MSHDLDELLDMAVEAASARSHSGRGMAAVALRWFPYDCKWVAEASWSNNTRVLSTPWDDKLNPLLELIDILTAQ